MSANRNQSFLSQPDAWVTFNQAGGAITAGQTGNNAVATYTGVGIYTITLGEPIGTLTTGLNCKINVDFAAAAGLFCRVVHTSTTVKTLTFTDSANAAAEATRVAVTVHKLSS